MKNHKNMTINEFLDLIPKDRKQITENKITISGIIIINENLEITSGKFEGIIEIINATFKRNVSIIDTEISNLQIKGSKGILIQGGTYNELEIKQENSSYTIKKIKVRDIFKASINNLYLSHVDIRRLQIESVNSLNILSHSKIEEITIIKSYNSQINILNSELNSLELIKKGQANIESMIFKNVVFNSKSSYIILRDLTLKYWNVINSNLQNTNLKLKDVDLNEIKSYNTQWFKRIIDLETNKEKRDAYRLFKIAMIKQHDRLNELFFKSKELEVYTTELNWIKDFRTWILLKFSKVTNNFGQDWGYALLWLFGLGFLFYLIYILLLPIDMKIGIGDYFYFLTPTHPIDFLVKKKCLTQWAITIDIINRITTSFFIYQFIAAFRRFGRN